MTSKLLLLLALVAFAAGGPAEPTAGQIARTASTDDWQRLPDGRVIIRLKDTRVALPAAGPDIDSITFTDRRQIEHKMTLRQVIEAPASAKHLFNTTTVIVVDLPNRVDRQGLYLGKFRRSELQSVGVSFAVGTGAATRCQSWTKTFSRLVESITPNGRRIASGWYEFKVSERPLTLAYVRSRMEPEKSFFPGISCDYLHECGSTKCLMSDLAASYGFNGARVSPQEWLSLDQNVHQLLTYIFIDPEINGSAK